MPIGIMGGDSLSDSLSKKNEEGETRSHVLMLFPVTAGNTSSFNHSTNRADKHHYPQYLSACCVRLNAFEGQFFSKH